MSTVPIVFWLVGHKKKRPGTKALVTTPEFGDTMHLSQFSIFLHRCPRALVCAAMVAVFTIVVPIHSLDRGEWRTVTVPAQDSFNSVQYQIYLPEGYVDSTSKRYPVVFHLHGRTGYGLQKDTLLAHSFERAYESGTMRQVIYVAPNGGKLSWWADMYDNSTTPEKDLTLRIIPHLDENFRTIPKREMRVIQGFSMGGWGATLYACKYPELFGVCVEYDGFFKTFTQFMAGEFKGDAPAAWNSDSNNFNQFSPWYWSTINADKVKMLVSPFRMAASMYANLNLAFKAHLDSLGIQTSYYKVGSCKHYVHTMECILLDQGANNLSNHAFIEAQFAKAASTGTVARAKPSLFLKEKSVLQRRYTIAGQEISGSSRHIPHIAVVRTAGRATPSIAIHAER